MLEATTSVFDKLCDRTGLSGDGAALVDAALSLGKTGNPKLRINELATQTPARRPVGGLPAGERRLQLRGSSRPDW